MALALLCAGNSIAAPTDAQRREIREAVARKVLDQSAADAIETAKWIRVVILFEHDRGQSPDLHPDAAQERLARDFVPVRRFLRLPVLAGYVNASALAALVADPHVLRISLEGAIAPQLAQAVPLVNLDDLHAQGLRGAGAQVAMLDTGVDLPPRPRGRDRRPALLLRRRRAGAGRLLPERAERAERRGRGSGRPRTRDARRRSPDIGRRPCAARGRARRAARRGQGDGRHRAGLLSDPLEGLDWMLRSSRTSPSST